MTNTAQKSDAPYRYLFGPVPSRRLGLSLGVDLFEKKVCNFNCPYCECGPTVQMPLVRSEFVPFDDVAAELRRFLPHPGLDFVTFSGNGEPTLYSRLADLIRLIRTLSDTRVAVITNSALIMDAEVRNDLAMADVVMPSLDAVTQEAMRRINKSHPSILASEMIDGLVAFRKEFAGEMDLEIFFCQGLNDDDEEVRLLADAARRIGPDRVQLNTIDRPPADPRALPVTPERMQRLRAAFTDAGVANVEIIGAYAHAAKPDPAMPVEEQILSLILRRGVNEQDLIDSLGLPETDARTALDRLISEGRITRIDYDGRPFYHRPPKPKKK
ncbi:MAG: radical SAM protein [Deltaproteobacteria bacterium]|nr:radical SAM protein [Deltaproteobacteria bacterium]